MAAMRRIARTVALGIVLFGLVVATAPPAAAHSVAGVSGTNYRTRLLSMTPPVPGLELRVIEIGSRLELTNGTAHDATVLGYQDEPYLRVGPDGVFENARSPATYINASRKGTTPVPSTASSTAPPEWRKVSSSHTARWHDHRAHWMGDKDPPVVRRAPGRQHVIVPEWRVEMQWNGQTVAAVGDLVWVPGPSPLPWVLLIVAALVVVALAGLTRAWAPLIAGALVAVVGVDVVHAAGVGFAAAGTTAAKLARLVSGSFFSVVAWVVAVVAIKYLVRRSPDGLLLAAFAGVVIALFGGVADLSALSRSQVPFAFSPAVARAAVSLTTGLGFGVAVGAVLAIVRHGLFQREDVPEAVEAA
jgi:hypothetical protein